MEKSLEIPPSSRDLEVDADPPSWAARCLYWEVQTSPPVTPKRRTRRPKREALILTGHGMRLRVDSGALHIRGGLTHYPQKPEIWRFFPGDPAMPSRIIVVDGSGGLSFDVMSWLSEQNVPFVRIDWRGQVTSVVGNGQATDPRCVAKQRNVDALPIAISLVRQKLENSIETLQTAVPQSSNRDRAIERTKLDIRELDERSPTSLAGLLGIEGRSAQFYFSAWQGIQINWSGIARRPVPADWQCMDPRQSANGGKKGKNKRASHPINAMLNYAYAILENHVRTQIVAQGFDPSIGYLHASDPERHALVFDLMEPLRPLVDQLILGFISANTFTPRDFTLRSDGVCRVNPQLTRRLVAEFVNATERRNFVCDFLP